MAELSRSFEADLQKAILDDAEHKLTGQPNNLVFQAIQHAHERLRAVGDRFDYNVEPIIDSFVFESARREDDRLVVRFGWEHEAAIYLEFGTSPHTVEGQPILSFVWEDPPQWVREEFDQARDPGGRFQSGYRVFFPEVEVEGIAETRYIRNMLEFFRREVRR